MPRTSADVDTKELGIFVRARSNGVVTQVFVEPFDKYGFVPLGPTDQLLVFVPGQTERPFVVTPRSERIAQILASSPNFAIILVRKGKRFKTEVEMPPAFSLEAYHEEIGQGSKLAIVTNWKPSVADSTMALAYWGPRGEYVTPTNVEVQGGTWRIYDDDLKSPDHGYGRQVSSDMTLVTATRKGGKITLDPALATLPHAPQLEQIRTTVVGPPRPPPPPPPPPAVPKVQVATDPVQ